MTTVFNLHVDEAAPEINFNVRPIVKSESVPKQLSAFSSEYTPVYENISRSREYLTGKHDLVVLLPIFYYLEGFELSIGHAYNL